MPLTDAEIDEIVQESLTIDLLTILGHMKRDNQMKWGLPIVRCTYKSQPRWEQFLAVLHGHIQHDFLDKDPENGPDLQSTLVCNIIEDEERLEGASWKEARNVFDEWVLQDIKAHPLEPPIVFHPVISTYKREKNKFKEDIARSPYWQHFIYVDETSVASVLDHVPSEMMKVMSPHYWITVVISRLSEYDADGNLMGDDDDIALPRELYKKFKIDQFLRVYATLAHEYFSFANFRMSIRGDDIWSPH